MAFATAITAASRLWLRNAKAAMSGTFLSVPERQDIPLNADEQLIVELYSK